jgi:hypothetical protein
MKALVMDEIVHILNELASVAYDTPPDDGGLTTDTWRGNIE